MKTREKQQKGETQYYMQLVSIGLSEAQRQGVVNLLNQDLSDAYLLAIETKKHQRDVVGPQFRTLHELWEEHYSAISISLDAYAERVRMLSGYPTGTANGFLENATPRERPGNLHSAFATLIFAHSEKCANRHPSHQSRGGSPARNYLIQANRDSTCFLGEKASARYRLRCYRTCPSQSFG